MCIIYQPSGMLRKFWWKVLIMRISLSQYVVTSSSVQSFCNKTEICLLHIFNEINHEAHAFSVPRTSVVRCTTTRHMQCMVGFVRDDVTK